MIRRLMLAAGALWIGVCLSGLIIFVIVTVQIYEVQADGSLWSHWLAYHMIDMRWRAFAVAGIAALPGVILSIHAAQRRERKG